jgi:hypothetical protein
MNTLIKNATRNAVSVNGLRKAYGEKVVQTAVCGSHLDGLGQAAWIALRAASISPAASGRPLLTCGFMAPR